MSKEMNEQMQEEMNEQMHSQRWQVEVGFSPGARKAYILLRQNTGRLVDEIKGVVLNMFQNHLMALRRAFCSSNLSNPYSMTAGFVMSAARWSPCHGLFRDVRSVG
jgi:hypothetical protein